VVWFRFKTAALNPEDAFLVSYPRSGTTWLRFLLFEALTGKDAEFGQTRRAIPSLTKHHDASPVLGRRGRLIQIHETFCDNDRRIIYAVRDPRSVAVSEYQWQQRMGLDPGSLGHFVAEFVKGRSNPWGAWDRHVSYWLNSEAAARGHLHLVKFEDLRKDPESILTGILRFLDRDINDETISRVVQNNSVERMRRKEDEARTRGWRTSARSDIRFVNTGNPAGWANTLSDEQVKAIEEHFGAVLDRLGYPTHG